MSNKKDKIQETLDERLYRESGVKPVSKDHPIYKRGASIRLIPKKSEKKKYNIPFSDQNPNVELVDNRIRIIDNNGHEIFLSEIYTDFLLFKFEELNENGASKELIKKEISKYISFFNYLNTLSEKERSLILNANENDLTH